MGCAGFLQIDLLRQLHFSCTSLIQGDCSSLHSHLAHLASMLKWLPLSRLSSPSSFEQLPFTDRVTPRSKPLRIPPPCASFMRRFKVALWWLGRVAGCAVRLCGFWHFSVCDGAALRRNAKRCGVISLTGLGCSVRWRAGACTSCVTARQYIFLIFAVFLCFYWRLQRRPAQFKQHLFKRITSIIVPQSQQLENIFFFFLTAAEGLQMCD